MPAVFPAPSAHRSPAPLWLVICLLGITQIVGYGTISYSYAILAPGVAAEFGVDPTVVFLFLSAAMLLAGITSPLVGRLVDQRGAAGLMAVGSVVVALLFGLLALSPVVAVYAMLIVVLQVTSTFVLYGGAFPLLAQFGGSKARASITYLTLIAGLASTLFWPLTGWLAATLGWRWTLGLFGLLHLGIALPIHWWIAARHRTDKAGTLGPGTLAPPAPQTIAEADKLFAFWCMAASFGVTAILSTSLVVHLVPILDQSGLGSTSYLVSMVIGPAMLLIRVSESVLWKNVHPLVSAVLAALCFPVATTFLLLGLPPLVAGLIFAVIYGFGHGLSVIVFGTLPLALFGSAGYGELFGRLSASRVLLGAGAPAAFAAAIGFLGFIPALTVGVVIGFAAVLPLLALRYRLNRAA